MSRYKPYSKYKESGLAWLGEVPEHWISTKIKFEVPFQVGWTPPTKDELNFEGTNKWVTIGDLKEQTIFETKNCISDEAAQKASMSITPKGSLLYSFKLSVGTVAFAGEDLYTNEAIASFLKNNKTDLLYLYYSTPLFILQNASINIYGAKILNQELIRNANIALPLIEEQQAIANFLDNATCKIDMLIQKQQNLIELLKEKRQALISHAVTKGLNPHAKMKDSGVEWLGEVPKHWEVKRVKFLFKIRKRIAGEEGYDVLSITQKGIKVKDIESNEGQLSMDYSKYQFANIGDFAMNHMDLLTGYVDITKFNGVISPDYRVFTLEDKSSFSNFYLYIFQNGYKNKIFYKFGQGSSQLGRWRLPTDEFNDFIFPYPSFLEQQEIANYLDNATCKIDILIAKAQKAIELLKERRTALISATVTGKIDVREIA